ncbi:MAG: hypothetical protein JXR96_12275 [Deltaproteobacteria bacterium]|nr:hypothetical protein [Deltaproteobacteria bacterium]
MNRLFAIALISFAAGCGSSGGPALFGGFSPAGGSALIFAPAVCDISFVGSSAVAGIALDFTSYQESCDVIDQTQLCGNKASSTRVLVVVLAGEVGAAEIDPAGPGTYSYLADPPSAAFTAAMAEAVQADEACDPLPGTSALDMVSGSVEIASMSGTAVSGSTKIHFENGESFEHSFDLPICEAEIDLCSRFVPCTNHVCVP